MRDVDSQVDRGSCESCRLLTRWIEEAVRDVDYQVDRGSHERCRLPGG